MSTNPSHLTDMLTRLKLTALRDQLDTLLDEASRKDLIPNCNLTGKFPQVREVGH
jgi:hypothetical protein